MNKISGSQPVAWGSEVISPIENRCSPMIPTDIQHYHVSYAPKKSNSKPIRTNKHNPLLQQLMILVCLQTPLIAGQDLSKVLIFIVGLFFLEGEGSRIGGQPRNVLFYTALVTLPKNNGWIPKMMGLGKGNAPF